MHRAQDCVAGAVRELMETQPLSPGKVDFAWRLAVGPRIARLSAARLSGNVLDVEVGDPRWAREITNLSGQILARLRALLGREAVQRIVIR